MKTIENFLSAILIVSCMTTLLSCNTNDYRKACADKDWATAYKIAEEIRNEGLPYKEKWDSANGARYEWAVEAESKWESQLKLYNEAIHYITLQEAMSVLEEHGENGIARIIAISKEHDAYWLLGDLSEILRQSGNDELADRLQGTKNQF